MSLLLIVTEQLQRIENDDDEDICITIEASLNPGLWTQITQMNLNMTYPFSAFSDPPLETLQHFGIVLPDEVELNSWEPQTFATFDHAWEDVGELAKFLTAYLELVLKMPAINDALKITTTYL